MSTLYQITEEQAANLRADQDEAAKAFWAYPNADWQFAFQANWLLARFDVVRAHSPDGLVWGAVDECPKQ